MIPSSLLPWQIAQWQTLWESYQKKQLAHALLLVGASGLGKKQFAELFSAAILCDQRRYCGQCHSCHLLQAKSHPDLIMIEPDEAGRAIKIDQIRGITHFVNETAMQGGSKVIIIHPAHAMNLAAANALLKTLEEPAPNTLLILISDQSLRLPATVLSRCQKIIFQKPTREVALQWLATQLTDHDADLLLNLAEGAPLQAIECSTTMKLRHDIYQGLTTLSQKQADPLQLAAAWQDCDVIFIYHLLLSWLRDLLRLKLTHGEANLINQDYQAVFAKIIQKISIKNLLNYLELVQRGYAKIVNLPSLNKQLLLEELFIRWTYAAC